MTPLDLMVVVGARPQFIKAAALFRAIYATTESSKRKSLNACLIHTGQHYDHGMSQVFFEEMELPEPAANLGVGSGLHGTMTARMLEGLEREMLARRPAVVVTFGDTNSTLAGALAAAKLRIPTAHVEAGLRSFNRAMPEEINRIVADHISDFLFCPSEPARAQLQSEGITKGVHVVGDVMYDAALFYRAKAVKPNRQGSFALATLHREENVENSERLASILRALARAPLPVVLPAHPRTRRKITELGLADLGAIEIIEPLSYFSMLGHLDACSFVVTDSGGLQKEAFYFGKRCITVRDETEWTELVEIGANRLAGANQESISREFDWARSPLTNLPELYGSGNAAERIVEILCGD